MTFDEYCSVRQEPEAWRSRKIALLHKFEKWVYHKIGYISKVPLVVFRPWFGFRERYDKAQAIRLLGTIKKLQENLGHSGTEDYKLAENPSVTQILYASIWLAEDLNTELKRRTKESIMTAAKKEQAA